MLGEGLQLQDIRDLVKLDFAAVNQVIMQNLQSDVELIQQVSQHIIHSGGKRLRPLLVLLSARALGYQKQQHIDLAAIIEFIHTATLLHDDVVDASKLRRGRTTANAIWGNEASILVGDFLYSRTFQMTARLQNLRVIEVLSNATNLIAEGEVLQLMNRNNPETSEDRYMNVIRFKTAKLFEAATQLGAIIAQCSSSQEHALTRYGLYLGTAYQLIDDVLDYSASTEELGKNLGDDLAEGKPTLPLIYALQNGTSKQADIIRSAVIHGGIENLAMIMEIIQTTNALKYTQKVAIAQANLAQQTLEEIPDSPYRNALESLTQFVIERKS